MVVAGPANEAATGTHSGQIKSLGFYNVRQAYVIQYRLNHLAVVQLGLLYPPNTDPVVTQCSKDWGEPLAWLVPLPLHHALVSAVAVDGQPDAVGLLLIELILPSYRAGDVTAIGQGYCHRLLCAAVNVFAKVDKLKVADNITGIDDVVAIDNGVALGGGHQPVVGVNKQLVHADGVLFAAIGETRVGD